jgi:hypothetical protein
MKRYLLFGYDLYSPVGGMNDCLFTSDSIDDCKGYLRRTSYLNYHVYDTVNRQYVDLHVEGISFDLPEGYIEFA